MASKVFKDRAKETASAAASGIYLELEGAALGFTELPPNGEVFDYFVTMLDGSGWEIGRGRIENNFPLPNSLRRDYVYAEYNPNDWGHWMGKLTFPAGAKEVSCVIAADAMTKLVAMLDSPNNPKSYIFEAETWNSVPVVQTVEENGMPVYPAVATVYEYTASASHGYSDGSSDSGEDTAVVKQWKGVLSVDFSKAVVPGESSQTVVQDIRGTGLDFSLGIASGEFRATLTGLSSTPVMWSITIREVARATLEAPPA